MPVPLTVTSTVSSAVTATDDVAVSVTTVAPASDALEGLSESETDGSGVPAVAVNDQSSMPNPSSAPASFASSHLNPSTDPLVHVRAVTVTDTFPLLAARLPSSAEAVADVFTEEKFPAVLAT
mgnify:CR=1 FL=1